MCCQDKLADANFEPVRATLTSTLGCVVGYGGTKDNDDDKGLVYDGDVACCIGILVAVAFCIAS